MSIRPTIAERIASGRRVAEATCYPNVLTYRDMTVEELRREELEYEGHCEEVRQDREDAEDSEDDAEYIEALKQAGERFTLELMAEPFVRIISDHGRRKYTEAECIRLAALLTQGAAELRRRREASTVHKCRNCAYEFLGGNDQPCDTCRAFRNWTPKEARDE